MSSVVPTLAKLEQRAAQADGIIALLTKQLCQLEGAAVAQEKELLRQKNVQLKEEVARLTKQLVALEGGKQYYDFSKKVATPPAPAVAAEDVTVALVVDSKLPSETTSTTNGTTSTTNGTTSTTNETTSTTNDTTSASELVPEKTDEPAKKEGVKGKKGGKKPAEPELPVDVGRLDFRVGFILSAERHPDAESLYVEQIDCGEETPRTVVSGLVRFVPLEEMQNRPVVVLCNLKPAKMRGVVSQAMVMCASTAEKVEILCPPAGSCPGDLVEFEGFPRQPDAVLNPKKKIFEACAPDLQTSSDRVATYKGVAMTVAGKGVVTSPSLAGVQVK